ncbi:synembryn [Aspergillus ibericus CBS 121593]|uniref:Synembryn n=1 Tax=Aspergillus ibericus CBS 121593 TaxID=1448316 RepID=A0A395GIV3_9EURO|nr:hypothetical protein BO80DRAFT_429931 [Aspergillus ibericus CBS 121593]RAK95401.1 hypothetical protein BO80DRAFT_429931 [Aspergillus ibericus CBS 121593]
MSNSRTASDLGLLDDLDPAGADLPWEDVSEKLETLRNYIVNGGEVEPLSTERCLSILRHYAFDTRSNLTSQIALRCLSNIILLSTPAKQIFVDQGYPELAILLLQKDDPVNKFLSARLLFLCTSKPTNYEVDVAMMADTINASISRFVNIPIGRPTTNLATDALCEILKLTCNIAASYPLQSSAFHASRQPILQILSTLEIPLRPLQTPISTLIDCLVFLIPDDTSHSAPIPYEEVHITRLVHILDLATQAYAEDELGKSCSPLMQVLFLISQTAPTGIKALLQTLLLPTDKDRESILGTGNSLSSRLLRLSTSISADPLRILIQRLLFELSNNDEKQLIHNIGYGYASGYLYSMGKQPFTHNPARNVGQEEGGQGREVQDVNSNQPWIVNSMSLDVNPLTGQRRDMETQPNLPEMTPEEKEREAERLFVQFERLRENGIIKVENPVAVAMREGRLEEDT